MVSIWGTDQASTNSAPLSHGQGGSTSWRSPVSFVLHPTPEAAPHTAPSVEGKLRELQATSQVVCSPRLKIGLSMHHHIFASINNPVVKYSRRRSSDELLTPPWATA